MSETGTLPASAPAEVPVSSSPSKLSPMYKRPLLAGFLSAFPGVGNIYNGLYLRGLAFFLMAVTSIHMVIDRGELWGFVVAFVWIFNIIDAWRQANLINLGYSTDLGVTDTPRRQSLGRNSLIPGFLLIVFGFAALLDLAFDIDVDWLIDAWPIYLIVAGIWLVVSALKAQRRNALPSEPEQRLSDEVDHHDNP